MFPAASSMWSQMSSSALASSYMSSRSNGVTKVRLSRSTTSRVRRSPSCSRSLMSRSSPSPRGNSSSSSRRACAIATVFRAARLYRTKNSRFWGTRETTAREFGSSVTGPSPVRNPRSQSSGTILLVARAETALPTDEPRLLNRELSWLDYDARVLAAAADPGLPALERSRNCAYFSSNLDEFFQVLTPLAVGPGQPFPYISPLSLSLGIFVRDPETGDERFARVKVPELLPRFLAVGERGLLLPLERVIRHFLGWLFPKMEILECCIFRVTRDADFELSDEADDLREAVESELRRRRFGDAVRV